MRTIGNRLIFSSVLVAASLVTAGSLSVTASASSHKAKIGTITIGTLYANTGAFATTSMPQYAGLKFWVREVNASGGIYVKPLKKKEKVKLIAYNDQSDPATATVLYNQLITQNHVDLLASDFGSVLTAPAITIARNDKRLLFDQTGSGTVFFSNGANPYVVLASIPVSSEWPKPIVGMLQGLQANRVAILYGQNDFDQAQASTVDALLLKSGITPVYYQGVPTTQSDYSSLVQSIQATNPDAVLEFGYTNNDIAFLNQLASINLHFKLLLTVFPSQLPALFAQDVGTKGLAYTYTYAVPPVLSINLVNMGLGMKKFANAYAPGNPSSLNYPTIAGYNTGLVIQAAMANATSMSQLGIRAGVTAVSGKLHTLVGTFKVDNTGEQLGERFPIGQIIPSGSGTTIKMVYPGAANQATLVTGKPLYPAPAP